MCILPGDLKSFFLTTNGLLIQWSIKFDGNLKACFCRNDYSIPFIIMISVFYYIKCTLYHLLLGSVLPLGRMELNPVAGLVLLSKSTTVSDDKPSLADLDSDTDEEDEQGTIANY